MAIHEVTDAEVLQSCAKCNAENRIALSGVDVGVARDDQSDARKSCCSRPARRAGRASA